MTDEQKILFDASLNVRKNSYSPYSQFKVGAALKASSGKIYTGANVENASYGGTVCAERIAIFNAISAGETQVDELLVVADTEGPCSPCGFCRQVMSEFMDEKATVTMANIKGEKKELTMAELLPDSFKKSDFMD